MAKFELAAFADEYSPVFDEQIKGLIENGISNLGFTTLHKIVTAINMPANILFYENERTDIPAKQLIIMELNDCTENELKQLFRIVTLQKSIMREKNNPKSPQQ